tara:strand:+ start:4614 stop:4832 length:219 start_codon:yes stop_codon:yes gene_type:complete
MGIFNSLNIVTMIGDLFAFAYRELAAIIGKKKRKKTIKQTKNHTAKVKEAVKEGDATTLNKEFGWDKEVKKP